MKTLALVLVAVGALVLAGQLARWRTRPRWQVAASLVALPVALLVAILWARSGVDPVSDGSLVIAVLVGAAIGAAFRPRVTGRPTARSSGPGT